MTSVGRPPDRYREVYESFRWDVPARFNLAQACCGRWAGERHRLALYWEDESGDRRALAYWDLEQAANRLSNALSARGVRRGDRVAIILPQRPETIVAYLAAWQMGAVAVPLSFLFGPDALEYRLANSGARAAIVDPQTLAALAPVRPRLAQLRHVIGVAGAAGPGIEAWDEVLAGSARDFDPVDTAAGDPSTIIYTSGTTGPPKGALLPHAVLLGNLPGFEHSQ
jgi:acetyl-CoA synthetase